MWLLISEHHCYRLSSASLECESWQVSNTIRKKSVKKKKNTAQHWGTTLKGSSLYLICAQKCTWDFYPSGKVF